MFHDAELGFYEVNKYCSTAKKVAGKDGVCTECPFKDCINDMKPAEKGLILQAPVIKQTYAMYDKSRNINMTAEHLGLTYNKVYSWLQDRNKIEEKLNAFAPV